MRTRRTIAMALIAGVATGTAVVGAALPASAAAKGGAEASAAGNASITGPASTASRLDAPEARKGVAPKSASASLTTVGYCDAYSNGTGDLCLWYYSNYGGSNGGFYGNDADLYDDRFVTAGSGQGARMTNNTESAWNYDRIYTAWVYTSPNYSGYAGYIRPWTGGNFTSTFKNNVESLSWS